MNSQVAIKKMKRKFYSWNECINLREVQSLKIMKHQNIIEIREVIRECDSLYFIFEFMEGGNLFDLMKRTPQYLTSKRCSDILSQVLQGLSYMHSKGFFHRDIKPENLLIQQRSSMQDSQEFICKIADFGLAREVRRARNSESYTEYVSTRWYRAPEVILRDPSYSSPIDLFAVGCIMAELKTFAPLFPGSSEIDQIDRIFRVTGQPTNDTWPQGKRLLRKMNVQLPSLSCPTSRLREVETKKLLTQLIPTASKSAIILLDDLLQLDPHRRPTASEALNYDFFTEDQFTFTPTREEYNLCQSTKTEQQNNSLDYLQKQISCVSPTRPCVVDRNLENYYENQNPMKRTRAAHEGQNISHPTTTNTEMVQDALINMLKQQEQAQALTSSILAAQANSLDLDYESLLLQEKQEELIKKRLQLELTLVDQTPSSYNIHTNAALLPQQYSSFSANPNSGYEEVPHKIHENLHHNQLNSGFLPMELQPTKTKSLSPLVTAEQFVRENNNRDCEDNFNSFSKVPVYGGQRSSRKRRPAPERSSKKGKENKNNYHSSPSSMIDNGAYNFNSFSSTPYQKQSHHIQNQPTPTKYERLLQYPVSDRRNYDVADNIRPYMHPTNQIYIAENSLPHNNIHLPLSVPIPIFDQQQTQAPANLLSYPMDLNQNMNPNSSLFARQNSHRAFLNGKDENYSVDYFNNCNLFNRDSIGKSSNQMSYDYNDNQFTTTISPSPTRGLTEFEKSRSYNGMVNTHNPSTDMFHGTFGRRKRG